MRSRSRLSGLVLSGLVLSGLVLSGLVLSGLAGAPQAAALGEPVVRLVAPDRVAEGRRAVVRLVLDEPVGHDVSVRLDTRAGTAFSPGDYRGRHERVRIPAGATAVRVEIRTVRDAQREKAERFAVRLTQPSGAALGTRRAVVTIRNRAPLPRVRVLAATFTEPTLGHRLGFTEVTLSAPSRRRVVVQLSTRSGTALAGADFVPLHPTVVFEPGETSQPMSVELLSDEKVEPPETMRVVVTGVRHATAARVATMRILDADPGRPVGLTRS